MTQGLNIPGAGLGLLSVGQGLYVASATAIHRIGERFQLGCRVFYYAKFAQDSLAGKVNSSDQSLAGGLLADGSLTAAIVAGDRSFSVTHASALDYITLNMLAGGNVVLTDSAGYDRIYTIKSNTAMASDIVTITVEDYCDTIAMADATTGVQIIMNPFMNLRPAVVATDELPIGVPLIDITAATAPYAWVQTWGPCGVVDVDDTAIGGCDLVLDGGTAGAVTITDTVGDPRIGVGILDITTAADMGMVFLQICP